MPRVICEFCDNRLVAPMSLVGKQATCPVCGRVIRIMPAQLNLPTDVPGTGFSEQLHMNAP